MSDELPFHVIKDGIVYELEAEEGGGYVVSVPSLPGCMSVGDSIDEANDDQRGDGSLADGRARTRLPYSGTI